MLGGGKVYWLGVEASPSGETVVNNPIIFMINDYENYVGYPHKFEVMIMKFKLKITRGTQTL